MAHIVCITTGLTGMLHASFEIVSRLEAAGHTVLYACPWDVRERVSAQGFSYRQLPEVVFKAAPELPAYAGLGGKLKRQWIKLTTAKQRRRVAMHALGMEEFADFLRETSPDFLLLDIELAEHIITAFTFGIPFALLSQWFSGWKRPGLPPLTSAVIPDNGRPGQRLAIEWAWWRLRAKRWLDIQQQRIFTVFTDRRSILRLYAKNAGFPTGLLELYNWPPPFTYRQLPVLSMTAWELEFPHQPRPGMYYVGPMVYSERKDPGADAAVIAQLEGIIAEKRRSGKKLIHCSLSTMQEGDAAFLKRLVQALAERPEWVLVLGLGGQLKADSLGTLPGNVHAFKWIPQLQVLQHADCSINHGGIHTINECIHCCVPMLIYSGKSFDQNGCAARIAYHGLGIMADKDRDDVPAIRQKIERVLSDESLKRKVKEVHRQVEKNKGRLSEVVEQLMQTKYGR
jgi:zeaxanthin glucosyltransferase